MKELYISPEMKLLSFAPAEKLANSDVSFDDLLAGLGGGAEVSSTDGDIDLDITIN